MFFVICNIHNEGEFWYLSYADHLKLFSTVLTPLAQRSASFFNLDELPVPIMSLLSCAAENHDRWTPYLAPISYSNSFTLPKRSSPDQALLDFNEKLSGHVRRFCTSADPDLAILILKCLHPALETHLHVLSSLVEETLRNYLTHVTPLRGAFKRCISVVRPPGLSWYNSYQALKSQSTPFYLRITLEHFKLRADEHRQGLEFSISVFEPVLQFQPTKNREFEILILWFFLLETVAKPEFKIIPETLERIELFKIQLSSGDMDFFSRKLKVTKRNMLEIDEDSGALYLASKAILIYLNRILCSKMDSAELSNEIDEGIESLYVI